MCGFFLFLFVQFCFYHLSGVLFVCLFVLNYCCCCLLVFALLFVLGLVCLFVFILPFFSSFFFSFFPLFSQDVWLAGLWFPGQEWGLSLGWECQVQEIGMPENSQPQGIPEVYFSTPRPSSTQLPAGTRAKRLHQTTSKTGTQTHPSADRLPKGVLSPQTPQNIPPDAALPIRGTRSNSTHQQTGTSPSYQEAYTSDWTNHTHWRQTPEARVTMTRASSTRGQTAEARTTILQPVEQKPH